MSFLRSIAPHGILPSLELFVHGLTPLSVLTALAVASIMACASMLLWVLCLVALHREGLV